MTRKSNNVVALLTIQKPDGKRLAVEVQTDAGLHDFYHWFEGYGRARRELRTSARSDGQKTILHPCGLEVIAGRFPQARVKITIRKKKLYRKLLSDSAEKLPGYKPAIIKTHFKAEHSWDHASRPGYGKRPSWD